MVLSGLHKLTLLDYPGLVACTVFTGGCNLRCSFCHNASLVLPERVEAGLQEDELWEFLEKRRDMLDGVAISGGEPLLHADLPDFLSRIKSMGYKIKLDTNGTFPERLRGAVAAGLVDRVAMDIKNSSEKYAVTVGMQDLDLGPIQESAAFILEGSIDYEFRTTAVRGLHEPEDFRRIGQWIEGAREYYIQSFCDSGDIIAGKELGTFSKDELRELAEAARPYVPAVSLRGI